MILEWEMGQMSQPTCWFRVNHVIFEILVGLKRGVPMNTREKLRSWLRSRIQTDLCIIGMMNFMLMTGECPIRLLQLILFHTYAHVWCVFANVWMVNQLFKKIHGMHRIYSIYSVEILSILWKCWHNCTGRDLQMKITQVRNASNWNIMYLN